MTKQELRKLLQQLAKRECWCDDPDFDLSGYCGGNFDDAYNGGLDDGEAGLAQRLLREFFGEES